MKLETWKSTLNQEERHYFEVNKGKGYQRHEYIFGYNPKRVRVRKIQDDLYELEIV